MDVEQLLNNIEREEREIREHKQKEVNCLDIETLKQMTPRQIKKAEEFFNIQDCLRLADKNLTKCLRGLENAR